MLPASVSISDTALPADADGDDQDLLPPELLIPPALNDPHLYLNRELSWLAFNGRVLGEAADRSQPLLGAGQVCRDHPLQP